MQNEIQKVRPKSGAHPFSALAEDELQKKVVAFGEA
jgi:hypothetical protein